MRSASHRKSMAKLSGGRESGNAALAFSKAPLTVLGFAREEPELQLKNALNASAAAVQTESRRSRTVSFMPFLPNPTGGAAIVAGQLRTCRESFARPLSASNLLIHVRRAGR